jgi:hypothetical protein
MEFSFYFDFSATMHLLFETFHHHLQHFRHKHVDAGSVYKGMTTRLKLQPFWKAYRLNCERENVMSGVIECFC